MHDLLAAAFEPDRLGLYAEQPYAAFDGGPPPEPWARLSAGLGEAEVRRTKEVLGFDADATFVVPDAGSSVHPMEQRSSE